MLPHKRVIIMSPKSMIKSAKNLQGKLQESLDIPVIIISPKSKTYQGRWLDFFINWGYSKSTKFMHLDGGNFTIPIADCVNKLDTFNTLVEKGVSAVEHTTSETIAEVWHKEGRTVIGRGTLTGHGGAGIDVILPDMLFKPGYKLYTLYKKKRHEYRVHVWNYGMDVIDVTQKKRKSSAEINTMIRNHSNGWVYCRNDTTIPDDLVPLAKAAAKALELKHCAVDIIWNEKENKCYVLEVNTAPGLVGTTLDKYAEAFLKDIV